MNNLIKIWLHQDTSIVLEGARSPITNLLINDATGTVTVEDREGNVIAGPVPFEYVPDSDAVYIGIIPEVTSAYHGLRARVIATLNAGTGYGSKSEWEYNAVFETRTQNSNCGC